MTETLRVLTFGAGAIGTYIGGSLALHGSRVVFLERPEVAYELRQLGLHLELNGKNYSIPTPLMAANLDEAINLGPYDVGIFALKSNDTQSMLNNLAPFQHRMPPLLCVQNGVDNEPAIAEALGPDKVIAGSVTSAIGRNKAGDITLERQRGIGITAGNSLSQRLEAVFRQAGLNPQLYPKAADMKWSKMLTNLLANATSAILDMSPAEIFRNPGLYRLEVGQLREALSVMTAQHIRPVNLPDTPVRLLAFVVRGLPLSLSKPFLSRVVGSGRGGKMPSFHLDLYSGGGKSEVDYLNGAVVRYGERFGIPTPINRLLNETLLALTRLEIPLEAFAHQPGKLIEKAQNP